VSLALAMKGSSRVAVRRAAASCLGTGRSSLQAILLKGTVRTRHCMHLLGSTLRPLLSVLTSPMNLSDRQHYELCVRQMVDFWGNFVLSCSGAAPLLRAALSELPATCMAGAAALTG
jgi:hypothetical protein